MNTGQEFELHPAAAQDITQIWEYIAADNITAASRIREQILAAIRSLVRFPFEGHPRKDLTGPPASLPNGRQLSDCVRSPRALAALLRGRD